MRLMTLVITIVMARLLLPEQFGLIAMLTIFTAVAQSFVDSGFGSALVQKKDVTQVDQCSIFYFNIAVALIAAGLLCLAAPAIAAFYDQTLLTPLTRVLSLNIVINSFGLVQRTLMVKRIDFKTQAKVSLIGTTFSGAIGITLAFQGFGVWSLAAQSLSASLVQVALLWGFNSWRPSLVFSVQPLRSMFSYGSRLLASGLLDTIFENIYLITIGKLFSAADLGFYTRADTLRNAPMVSLAGGVGRVTFPVFAAIGDDVRRLRRAMHKAVTTLVMVNFPMMAGLALTARPLVLLLLGERWAASIPYVQLLSIGGLLYPLHLINLNMLLARGRSDLYFRVSLMKKVLVVVNIVVMHRWGIPALIAGGILVSCLNLIFNAYYTGVLIAYPLRHQLVDVLPYLGTTGIMAAGVFSIQALPFPNYAALLAAQVLSGALIYMTLCAVFNIPAFTEAWSTVRARLGWMTPT